jgi:adenosylhomocysteine nucleosidase
MKVAIFCALRWECRPVLAALRQVSRQRAGGLKTWRAAAAVGEVVVVQSGVGLERAGNAAAAVAASERFDLFISAGCAGALGAELQPGDLVVADTIHAEGVRFDADAHFRKLAGEICEQQRLRWHAGGVLTSPTVLTTVAARSDAVGHSGAVAVEMEAAAIARVAAEHGIAFGEIRGVLDSADVELHESGDFMNPETGRLRPLEVLKFVATRPGAAAHLLELRRMMVATEGSLSRFFAAYFGAAA